MAMHRTTIYIPDDLLAKLKKHCAKTGMTLSVFLRRAAEAMLKKEIK